MNQRTITRKSAGAFSLILGLLLCLLTLGLPSSRFLVFGLFSTQVAAAEIAAEKIVWVQSRNVAISMARAEGKMILMLGGKPGCGMCDHTKNSLSEYSGKDGDIRGTIDRYYVPWYIADMDRSDDWIWYKEGYEGAKNGLSLPFMGLIDPANPKNAMILWEGAPWLKDYYFNLNKYKNGTPPVP